MERPSWQEHAMAIAIAASKRSEDIIKVGACALDHNNRVIGVAYNGLAAGKNVSPEFWNNRDARRPFMLHAETNLLALIKRGEARLIAVTLMPCPSCALNIAAHGIEEVVYAEDYRDTTSLEIFDFYSIKHQKLCFTL